MKYNIKLIFATILFLCVLKAGSNYLVNNKTFPIKTLPVESKELFKPSLEQIVKALKKSLRNDYKNVKVNIVDCPDLRNPPFSLASQGLGGSPTIFEAGSESYLMPSINKSKVYDFKDVPHQTGVKPTFILGAGAGPFHYLKTASEIIANLNIIDGKVHSLTQIGTVKEGKIHTELIPNNISTYAFMISMFVSQGKPGKVIEVKVSQRKTNFNFPSTIRSILIKAFTNKTIGLGGTFLVNNSKVNIHVQPQFSEIPLMNSKMRDDWLVFFNVSSPLVCMGTLITEGAELDLRPYHFHCLSDHNAAGHYHYDVDKDSVEYLGYFNVAEKVVRVDRPQEEFTTFRLRSRNSNI